MKSLKFDNPDMVLYMKSMGKIFRVATICKSDEANEFCRKNKDYGVIACDCNNLVYIANFYGKTCPSELIVD